MLFSSFSFCHGVKCKYGECKTDYLSIPLKCLIKICCVHAAPSCPELILLFRVIVMCLFVFICQVRDCDYKCCWCYVQVHSDNYVLLLCLPRFQSVLEMRHRFVTRQYIGMSSGHLRPIYSFLSFIMFVGRMGYSLYAKYFM